MSWTMRASSLRVEFAAVGATHSPYKHNVQQNRTGTYFGDKSYVQVKQVGLRGETRHIFCYSAGLIRSSGKKTAAFEVLCFDLAPDATLCLPASDRPTVGSGAPEPRGQLPPCPCCTGATRGQKNALLRCRLTRVLTY